MVTHAILNGVVIGHWDEAGAWRPKPKAAPYWPRPDRKRQQRLAVDRLGGKPRPLRNSDLPVFVPLASLT